MPLSAPSTMKEFNGMFPDEGACVEYLFLLRWPDGFQCPKCGTAAAGIVTTRALVRCKAGHQISVTSGTAMHRSKQKLWDWFYAVFLVSTLTPGMSTLQFQKQMGLTRYETAFQFLHKLRSALVDPVRQRLKGEVEVDEAYVGGPETIVAGQPMEKATVVSAIEVVRWEEPGTDKEGNPIIVRRFRAGRIRMALMPNTKQATLVPWVAANVEPDTLLVTNGTAVYKPLEKQGYRFERHVANRYGKATGDYLPLTGLIVSNLKAKLLGTYRGGVSRKHLQAYLNEFVFIFNRRFWRGPAFSRCLRLLVNDGAPLEYEALYAVGTEGGWVHPSGSPAGETQGEMPPAGAS
ncbi:MAG: IS1595 family transposase [Myxococcales bacterium]|nr:IS1595 family transposase [Myxococcales bacterium]